ncbi:MAG: hypothetical protein ACXU8N_11760 [Telluria sp.]
MNAPLDILDAPDPMAMMLAQVEQSNPQAAAIVRALQERSRAAAPAPAEEEDEDSCRIARADLEQLQAAAAQALQDIEALRARQAELAAALGACPLCFGSDPACLECGGRGQPGALAPEPAAFRTHVLPALRRARAIDARRRQYRAHVSPQPAGQAG